MLRFNVPNKTTKYLETRCSGDIIHRLSERHKPEFPPLFTAGFHTRTMEELRKMCVDSYPSSQRRPEIMAGLESIHLRLVGLSITGELWVDGSFLTKKDEPDDVDVVLFAPSQFFDRGNEQQTEFLNWLSDERDEVRSLFSCHSAAIAQYDDSRPNMKALYVATRNDYADKFGHSVATMTCPPSLVQR